MDVKAVKLEPYLSVSELSGKNYQKTKLGENERLMTRCGIHESDENRSSNALSTGQSSSSVLEQGHCSLGDNGVSSPSTVCPAPICRQFWKAGNYDDAHGSKVTLQNGKNYLHVHPLFLHSNATSHKWAFGAIAELLDNVVDEIQNGATFVIVDKVLNPRDGTPALLIQDDGGGMDPDALRQCMSFGFSDKKSSLSIGQYGNGFKTSSMRLGADVIVFSSRLNDSVLTRSIGLLSYSFLTRTGLDRIAVPMVDYEFSRKSGNWEISHRYGQEHFTSNLSLLLQWSPYSTEIELLNQFGDIGEHGTKIIIYNLWFSNDGKMELDFDSDPEDIRISGDIRKVEALPACRKVNEQHIANRLHYSLRAYLSVLYLKLPETFSIALRGKLVEHHNLAEDLKFVECILYKPQIGGCMEGKVITTIGFLKEAPQVNIHGFNVYHKNRLILPFWKVVNYADSRGRGVVGVLEANFVEPTHNKQDFERTSLFQRLEVRLKEMTWEYWDYHCGLIGYQVKKKIRTTEPRLDLNPPHGEKKKPVTVNQSSLAVPRVKTVSLSELLAKRKEYDNRVEPGSVKRQAGTGAKIILSGHSSATQAVSNATELNDQEAANLMEENKKLRAKCLDYDKRRKELELKATTLQNQLKEVQHEYDRLTAELASLEVIKEETKIGHI